MSTISCSPTFLPVGQANIPFIAIGVGTNWTGTPPTWTFAASSGANPVLTGGSVVTATVFAGGGLLSTVGCTAGATVTVTDTSTGDTYAITLIARSVVPSVSSTIPTAGVELSTLSPWAIQGNNFGTSPNIGTLTTQSVTPGNASTLIMAYNPVGLAVSQYIALDGPPTGLDSSGSVPILALTPTDNTIIGVLLNLDPITQTGIWLYYRYNSGSPFIRIAAYVNGTVTNLLNSSTTSVLTTNDLYTLQWSLTNQSITLGLYHGATQLSTITQAVSLGQPSGTTGTLWQPGYACLYVNTNVSGGVAATPTTGWRIGPITAKTSPRVAPLDIQSGSNYPFPIGLVATSDYAVAIADNFIGGSGNNYDPTDQWIWRIPLAAPLAPPAHALLLNNGSGSGSPWIPRSKSGQIAGNAVGWWLTNAQVTAMGGTHTGPSGRYIVMWSEQNNNVWEQAQQVGASSAYTTHLWTAYSDDITPATPTFSTPVDVTSQFKDSTWTECVCGPSNCTIVTQSGKLFATIWHNTPTVVTVSGAVTVSGTSGASTLTCSQSGANVVSSYVILSGDTTHQYFIQSVSGTTWTLGAGLGSACSTTLPTNITAATPSVTSYAVGGSIACVEQSHTITTTDPTGATGWTLGDSPGSHLTGGVKPNELQAVQLPNGTIFLVQRAPGGTAAPYFLESTNDGTTWAVYTPSGYPFNTPICTVGLAVTPAGTLLYSGPNSSSGRVNLTIGVSNTAGNSWNSVSTPAGNLNGTQIMSGECNYSSLCMLPSGNVLGIGQIGAVGSQFNANNTVLFEMTPAWLGLRGSGGACLMASM